MSNIVNKFKEFWGGSPDDEFEDGFEQLFNMNQPRTGTEMNMNSAVDKGDSSLNQSSAHLKVIDDYSATNEVVVLEPVNFNQAIDIIQYLKKGSSIVLNLSNLAEEHSQRLLDFVCGGVFALDGSQQRVGEGVFLLVPNSVNINPVVKDLSKDSKTAKFWS